MKIKRSPGEVTFDVLNIAFMSFVLFITLYPFWFVIVMSFNEGNDAARGGIYFWPRSFSLLNFQAVFRNPAILTGFQVTILRTIVGTIVHVLFTGMVAYSLSHSKLIFRKFYMIVGIITMFFGSGLIPYYLLIRNLGLRNTFWVYIFPAMFSFYDMIIMMTFFRHLPSEMSESAKIDGAGYWRIFLSIIIPLSAPIFATMSLFAGVYHWNDYFTAVLYIDKKELLPIQTILFKIIAESQASTILSQVNIPGVIARRKLTSESVKMATMVITTIPIICVYPFLQKYFVKGMLIGSVKG